MTQAKTNQMRILSTLTILFLTSFIISAQNVKEIKPVQTEFSDKEVEVHFEGFTPQPVACVPTALRTKMLKGVEKEIASLRKKGKLSIDKNPSLKNAGSFQWPLRASDDYDDCGYYSVFQYFDHNPTFGAVQDWNCGGITYDVPGYNHSGIDIGIAPFAWNMMNDNSVEVIAIADGQIIQKGDGFFDMECSASTLDWNFLIVQHPDGTFAMYGHMKSGTVTSLEVGDQISTGDYIGIVGSSGASTGPHLHLEILDQTFASIDPYAGPCNNQISSSLWADQHDYHDRGVNSVRTHSAPPNNNTCPSLETTNEQVVFEPGSQVYLGSYIRHAIPTDTYTVTMKRPDGSVFWTTNHTPNNFFASYMFYFSLFVPSSEQTGQWTLDLQSSYGDACSSAFIIGNCDSDLTLSLPVVPTGAQVKQEAANSIISTAVIGEQSDVVYDAGNCVELQPGFEVKQSALFEAFLDGCGGQ